MDSANLTTAAGVHAYLLRTPFAVPSPEHITPLTGGSGNHTFRATLATPRAGAGSVIIKHAEAHVKGRPDIPFTVARQAGEAHALRRAQAWLDRDSGLKEKLGKGIDVRVPGVLLYDPLAHVLILEDTGTASVQLKEAMMAGTIDAGLATRIGAVLGLWLRGLHGSAWGIGEEGEDEEVKRMEQEAVEEAKRISAWATYGRVVATLHGDGIPALADPPLAQELDPDAISVVQDVAHDTMQAVHAAQDPWVMGDFWPGNIMLAPRPSPSTETYTIYVLDWELAKPGLPAHDIGQFCAELDLLDRFAPSSPASSSPAKSMLQALLHAYAPAPALARTVLVHWGCHLVVWTPRVGWGARAPVRGVVRDGAGMILCGARGDREALRASGVGVLLGEAE